MNMKIAIINSSMGLRPRPPELARRWSVADLYNIIVIFLFGP